MTRNIAIGAVVGFALAVLLLSVCEKTEAPKTEPTAAPVAAAGFDGGGPQLVRPQLVGVPMLRDRAMPSLRRLQEMNDAALDANRADGGLMRLAFTLLLLTGCVTPATQKPERPANVASADAPTAALAAFLDAVDRRDFDAAFGFLGPPWSERYTPSRLREDFEREALSGERVKRLRLAMARPVEVSGTSALVRIDEARAAKLIQVDGQWRIVALE